jgi:cobalt-zinc-cadmium resistance protein CzcA
MIGKLVSVCIQKRWLVLSLLGLLAVFGVQAWRELAIEAYPDIADTTAQVITQFPGHAAEEVEQQVTVPLERELNGIPGLHIMRSKSTFGLSLITLVFVDGVEDYWARQRIQERIANVDLPEGVKPGLDPLTSPTGEIFRYTLESRVRGQRALKELQEWVVVPRLKQVFGVADVTSFGGETTQFQLLVDPDKLTRFGLALKDVTAAVQANNANAGGSVMVLGEQGFVVRGIGLVRSLDDLGLVVVTQRKGTPVFLRDLGEVRLGALQRSGVLGKDDNDDAVSGIVLLLRGENPSAVLENIHKAVHELNTKLLPSDVKLVPYLDRTTLVHTTLDTVGHTLVEGFVLVVIVLLVFLGSLRGAVIVALTIPFSLLFAFVLMRLTHIPANLLSLGAIDFGVIVNGSIVLMEVVLRRREENPNEYLTEKTATDAALQVAKPIFFATLIIITAYVPLFAFERVEKKLFTPMAYTVGYALLGALVFSMVAIPALSFLTYRTPRKIFHNWAFEWLEPKYEEALHFLLKRSKVTVASALAIAALCIGLGLIVGREFLPYLDEGSIWLQVQLPPGISLEKGTEMARELRQVVREFPEVSYIVTQLGRNDDGTDPWTPSHIEASVGLKPYKQWGGDKQAVIERMSKRLARLPGTSVGFSQPMIDGVNDKIAGAHSELVVKVIGNDFKETRRIAEEASAALAGVPGAADVAIDQEPPLPQLQIKVNREAAARFGINVSDVADLIETAVGGKALSQLFIGERRYDIAVRFIDSARNTPEAISRLTLLSSTGARIPLSQVADVSLGSGESTITREMNQRHLTVKLNLRGRALADFLKDAQVTIAQQVKYDPNKYQIVWGGQFENQERAQQRLLVIVPIVLALIYFLLYAGFGNVRNPIVILLTVPLALVGGLLALYFRGMTLNVSSAVGFIALFGVAVENGVIMIANLSRWREQGVPLYSAVLKGATERLRPVLMTGFVASLGLLPAALKHSVGSDVQRPLATVVVGGLISATLLTLVLLPAVYYIVEKRQPNASIVSTAHH